jgi:hypothetical protein
MPRTASLAYSAIRSEGALLPGSILGRIHAEDPRLPGMKPADFGLSGMRVREAASRAWNALQGPWHALRAERERLEANDPGTGMTRARWLTHVLRALDYGLVDALRSSLRVGDQEFPVSHLYGHAPLHLVGCGLDLDRRTAGAVGAARMSPHGMVQLLLNASESHLWGVVSNGLRWRLLRDSQSLSRQAMVEFDLEAIFERQLYNEFLLFFLVCHASRLKAERSEECLLEQWFALAGEEGKRALDTLRDGVQAAIEVLGPPTSLSATPCAMAPSHRRITIGSSCASSTGSSSSSWPRIAGCSYIRKTTTIRKPATRRAGSITSASQRGASACWRSGCGAARATAISGSSSSLSPPN